MSEVEKNGALIVSWDFSGDYDKNILLVGNQGNGVIEIVNYFQGKEAHEIHKKLTEPKKKEE